MATTKPFNEYTVTIEGRADGRLAYILCYDSGVFAGRIDFYPEGAALNSGYLWHVGASARTGAVVMPLPMSQFHAVLDILRTERPLQLWTSANVAGGAFTNGATQLRTSSREPVGEEESLAA